MEKNDLEGGGSESKRTDFLPGGDDPLDVPLMGGEEDTVGSARKLVAPNPEEFERLSTQLLFALQESQGEVRLLVSHILLLGF